MSFYYADTSAVVKMIIDEDHSSAMAAFFDEHEDWDWVSSALLQVEVVRAVRRIRPALLPEAQDLLEEFSSIAIDHDIVQEAMSEPDVGLRSLDAIHLATARSTGKDLAALVSYDQRLLAAARDAGLPTVSPTG